MSLESQAFGDSIVHRIDPRVRLCAAAGFSVVVALSQHFATLWPGLAVAVALCAAARLPARFVARRLLVVNGFIALLWLFLPFGTQGREVFCAGPFCATAQGLWLAALITVKSNAIVLFVLATLSTMSVARLGHAAHRLRVPAKLVHLLLFTYRYIFVLQQEYQQLVRATRVRAFVPKTGLHTYRTYAYLVGMLLVRASARAERVHQAMVCRGFSGRFHCLDELAFTRPDVVWAVGFSLITIALGLVEWTPLLRS